MPKTWTGAVVGTMHIYGITADRLAKEIGITPGYLSAILHSKREPARAKEIVWDALRPMVKERKRFRRIEEDFERTRRHERPDTNLEEMNLVENSAE